MAYRSSSGLLDIVLFVNGLPLVVIECKKGGPTCANPMAEAFVQLQRYMNRRKDTQQRGLKEGEPRLFHTNLMLIRTSGAEAEYGTLHPIDYGSGADSTDGTQGAYLVAYRDNSDLFPF